MPPKHKREDEEMRAIIARLEQQDHTLAEILMCLKGSEAMNIEGVIPALRRLEQKQVSEMKAITEWKDNIQKYADVIVSKPFKIFMTVVLLSFASMFLYIKFGAGAIVKFLSWIFE